MSNLALSSSVLARATDLSAIQPGDKPVLAASKIALGISLKITTVALAAIEAALRATLLIIALPLKVASPQAYTNMTQQTSSAVHTILDAAKAITHLHAEVDAPQPPAESTYSIRKRLWDAYSYGKSSFGKTATIVQNNKAATGAIAIGVILLFAAYYNYADCLRYLRGTSKGPQDPIAPNSSNSRLPVNPFTPDTLPKCQAVPSSTDIDICPLTDADNTRVLSLTENPSHLPTCQVVSNQTLPIIPPVSESEAPFATLPEAPDQNFAINASNVCPSEDASRANTPPYGFTKVSVIPSMKVKNAADVYAMEQMKRFAAATSTTLRNASMLFVAGQCYLGCSKAPKPQTAENFTRPTSQDQPLSEAEKLIIRNHFSNAYYHPNLQQLLRWYNTKADRQRDISLDDLKATLNLGPAELLPKEHEEMLFNRFIQFFRDYSKSYPYFHAIAHHYTAYKNATRRDLDEHMAKSIITAWYEQLDEEAQQALPAGLEDVLA